MVIEKPLHFVGGGYAAGDITPEIKGHMLLCKKASASSMTGISFRDGNASLTLDSISNMVISRCKLDYLTLKGIGANDLITECVIGTILGEYNYNTSYSCVISKCIIKGSVSYLSNITFNNNLFTNVNHVFSYSSKCRHILLQNNIFTYSPSTQISNSTLNNNLSYSPFSEVEGNTYRNNFSNYTKTEIFVDFDKGNYHLKDDCVGKNAGTDGTDIGIYGTAFPFKDNKLPSIPYFSIKDIAPETSADQKLKVNIKIEAQER